MNINYRKGIVMFLGASLFVVLTVTILVAAGVINLGKTNDVSVADDFAGRCGDGVIQAPNLDGVKEMCDGNGEYCTNNCTIKTNRADGVCRIGVVSHHLDVAGRLRDTQVIIDNGPTSVLARVNAINSALGPGSAEMVLIKPPQIANPALPYAVASSYSNASYANLDILIEVDSNLSNYPVGSNTTQTGTNQRVYPTGINPPALTTQLQGVANLIKANQLDGMHVLLTGDHGTSSNGSYAGDVANIFASTITNAMALGFNYQTPGAFYYVSNVNRAMPQLQTFGAPNFLSQSPVFYSAGVPAGDAWTPGLVTTTGTGPGQCYYVEDVRSGGVTGPVVGQTCLVGYVPPIDKGDGTYSGYVVLDAGSAQTVVNSLPDILKSIDDCNPERVQEVAVCGDGIVQNPNDDGFAEECDDGNTVDDDTCNNSCTVPPLQDPSIQKTNSVVSQSLTEFTVDYTLVATNPNAEAITATLTDVLPAGVVVNQASITPTGTVNGTTITWTAVTLQPGDNTFTYTATLPESLFGSSQTNTVTLDPEDPELTTTTDESTVTPDVNQPTIGKTGSYVDGTVTENGATIVYRVNANNLNNFPITIDVQDQPDSNVVIDVASVTASGGTYNASTNTITWSSITFAANESIDFEYYATLPVAFFGQGSTNTASLPGTDVPPVTVVVPPLDVNPPQIIKDYDGTSVVQNQNQTTVNYSLLVLNPNDFDLTVNVTDDLETGVTTTNISNGGVRSGTRITWPTFIIPANGSLTLTYTAVIPASLYGTQVDNIATVTAPATGDSDTDDETVSINIGSPTIEKTSEDPVLDVASSTINYSITVTNPNTFDITASVSDVLDSGVTVVSGSISNSGTVSGNTITWNNLTIPGSGSIELTYQISVPASYYADPDTCNTGGTDILNTATVTPQTGTPATDDHVVPALCVDPPYLSDKSAELIDIDSQSATYNYSVEVRNDFDIAFDNLDITDNVPNGATNITNISNGGVWDQANGVINWTDLSIAAGPNTTIQLTYTITYGSDVFGQDLVNEAIITVDDVPGNTVDNEENPDPNIDASIFKNSTQTVTEEGTVIDYSIRVTNQSDVEILDYSVVDTFDTDIQPGWVTNIGVGPNGITGILSGNTITWNDINLEVGEEIVLMYRVRIPRDVEGTFDNVAQLLDETDTPVDESAHSVVIIIVPEIIIVPVEIPVPTPENPNPTPVPGNPQQPGVISTGQIPDTAIYDDPIALALIGLSLMALGAMVYKVRVGEKLNFDGIFRKAGMEGYASGVDERIESIEEKAAEDDKEYVPKE